jgi:amidohydrolase
MSFEPTWEISHDVLAEAVLWRHELHKAPELAYDERQTARFIASRLAESGLQVHRGLAGTGVVGTLKRGTGRRTIGIRADMDALRIHEQSGVAHASGTPGVMHACGHDGHVAIALAAARICSQSLDFDGTVHFVFQPAEEGGAGARRMIEEGLFQLFPCDSIFALHNWPALPLGTCVARDGPMMAANAVVEIKISGRGCHGAMPHEGIDCVVASCQLVVALQSVVSRNVDPMAAAVLSITEVHGGSAHNVIPDACLIRGTARWFDSSVGAVVEHRIHALAKSIAAAFGCDADVRFDRRYPATINDAAAAASVRALATHSSLGLRVLDAPPSTASEDFAFMLQAVPGCYFWLGAGQSATSPGLHSPDYDFNDELLPGAVALWVALVRQMLNGTGSK